MSNNYTPCCLSCSSYCVYVGVMCVGVLPAIVIIVLLAFPSPDHILLSVFHRRNSRRQDFEVAGPSRGQTHQELGQAGSLSGSTTY